MGCEIRGQAAAVHWGYQPAARLGSWSVATDAEGVGTLTATIVSQDTFRMSQPSLTFRVDRPGQPWIWPITTLQIAAETLTASLGPLE